MPITPVVVAIKGVFANGLALTDSCGLVGRNSQARPGGTA